ncbi:Atp-binding protein, partial [Globisporangium splendens]
MHDHVASSLETVMGVALPRLEIRYSNLSLGVDMVTVASENDAKSELPTIANFVKKRYGCAGGKRVTVRKQILKNISGVIKPGSLTLILGQPGSGKSALMKVFSGQFPMDKNVVLEGDVSYNGLPRKQLERTLPQCISYVTQTDTHFPMLTVKETLAFAHECCGGGALPEGIEKQLANGGNQEKQALEAARAMYKHYPDIVTHQLGLQHCQDTVVGDAMLRGVSGGERKRVTTGEMDFGMKYATFMDEISTGLDSAATFDIVSTQRSIAKKFRKTVVIALLQPTPEVFALFDDVLILSEGQVLYHGPRDQVQGHFESLGFVCPPHRDIADFLCDIGTDQQRQYEVTVPANASIKTHPRRAREFADLFAHSILHDKLLADLNAPLDPVLASDANVHLASVPEFHQTFWASTFTLIRRQLPVTIRNKAFLRSKTGMVVIMGLLYASTFYQFNFDDVQVVMGILFFSILYLALTQSPMLPVYFSARDVFYKQRRANFFRTSSFALSVTMSQIPLTFVESVVFGTIVYWMCGFVPTAGAYLLFEVLLFLTNLSFSAYFFFLSCATPDVHVAKPLGLTTLLVCIVFSGFVVTHDHIPDYFIWCYWLNPIAWGVRSLAVSQYRNERHDRCVIEEGGINYYEQFGGKTMGEYYLSIFNVQTEKSWIAYGILFTTAVYVFFMYLAYYRLEHKRLETPENLIAPKVNADGEQDESKDDYQSLSTPRVLDKKSTNSSSNEETVVDLASHRELNFTSVTVAFEGLWYAVPGPGKDKQPIDLLKGVSGFALPGKMTALMGASGAGKTTLLDVIAGRKTGGTINGQIMLNGVPATALAIGRCSGYCEQMDIHADSATIREALTFSAFLRQGSDVSSKKKLDSVNECLELLDLDSIADRVIRGCSVEQLKRLTIGVELAAQPSVLFLDEPTSGLDARSAKLIMDGVRKVADTGRTILCTIHQPSTEVFMLFDSLLLLKRGGETVFYGDLGARCQNLIDYFQAIPGVPQIEQEYNPATWMLEVIGAGVDTRKIINVDTDFAAHFATSPLQQQLADNLSQSGIGCPDTIKAQLTFSNKRAANEAVQAKFLLQRFFRMYWRLPTYNWTRMVVHIFLGVLFGLIFSDAERTSYQGINAGLGMIFCTVAFLGIIVVNTSIAVASEERTSFYRERASQTYNAFWYFVGFTITEIPYVSVATLLFTVIFYPMVGFTDVPIAAFFWLILTLHLLLQIYIGQLLAFALPSVEVATVIGVLFNAIFVLFTGFSPPSLSIPSGYRWLFDITPHRYSFMAFSATLFSECSDSQLAEVLHANATNATINMDAYPAGCQVMMNAPQSIGSIPIQAYLDHVFGIRHDDIGYYLMINVIMIVVVRVLALLALRFINHQKK